MKYEKFYETVYEMNQTENAFKRRLSTNLNNIRHRLVSMLGNVDLDDDFVFFDVGEYRYAKAKDAAEALGVDRARVGPATVHFVLVVRQRSFSPIGELHAPVLVTADFPTCYRFEVGETTMDSDQSNTAQVVAEAVMNEWENDI